MYNKNANEVRLSDKGAKLRVFRPVCLEETTRKS